MNGIRLRPCPHVSGNFFFRKYFFADTKIFASTRSVFKWFGIRLYPEMNIGIIAILASFLPHHSCCKEYTVEACSLSLEKMSKSSEKVKLRCADAYKWSDDEAELLLTVTKEYKTKQFAKSTVFGKKICVFTNFRIRVDGALTSSAVFACRKRDYLVQHVVSVICCIEQLYGSCICPMNFFRTTDTTIWKPGLTPKAWFPYRCICRVCRTKNIHRTDTTLWKPPVQMLNTKETTDTTCCTR